jgi:hypothetical protein
MNPDASAPDAGAWYPERDDLVDMCLVSNRYGCEGSSFPRSECERQADDILSDGMTLDALSTCLFCRTEIPNMARLSKHNRDGLVYYACIESGPYLDRFEMLHCLTECEVSE